MPVKQPGEDVQEELEQRGWKKSKKDIERKCKSSHNSEALKQ